MYLAKATTLALILVVVSGHAGDTKQREACHKVEQQIRVLRAKMRNGYSAAQGIRYDEKMRKLKDKRYKLCR